MTLGTAVRDFTTRIVLDGGRSIEFEGPADITRETADAIVNAANSSLLGGGGVDGAIHRAGGPAILAECRQIVNKIGSLAAGKAVITTCARLQAKHVIHTVGPIYSKDRGSAQKLSSCHGESIRLADEHALTSLSFPAISTGAYGYPVSEAAPIAISSTIEALAAAKRVRNVRFVLFDISSLKAYVRAAEEICSSNSVHPCKIEKAHS